MISVYLLLDSFGIPGMGDERNTVMYGKRPVSFPGDNVPRRIPYEGESIHLYQSLPASTLIFLTPRAVLIERGGESLLVMGCCACHRGTVIRQTLCATQ